PPSPASSYTPSTRHPSRSPTSSNAPSAPAACTPVTCRYWRTGTPSHHLSCTGHGPAQPVTVTGLPAVRGVIRRGRPLSIPRASTSISSPAASSSPTGIGSAGVRAGSGCRMRPGHGPPSSRVPQGGLLVAPGHQADALPRAAPAFGHRTGDPLGAKHPLHPQSGTPGLPLSPVSAPPQPLLNGRGRADLYTHERQMV